MEESSFEEQAELLLTDLEEAIELADKDAMLDVELLDGVLTIEFPEGEEMVINRHAPSQEIWLASPTSGATHFHYDEDEAEWMTDNDVLFSDLVAAELEELGDIKVSLS